MPLKYYGFKNAFFTAYVIYNSVSDIFLLFSTGMCNFSIQPTYILISNYMQLILQRQLFLLVVWIKKCFLFKKKKLIMEVLGQHFKQFTEDYIKKSYQTKWSFA